MSYIVRYWFVKSSMCSWVKPVPDIANLKLPYIGSIIRIVVYHMKVLNFVRNFHFLFCFKIVIHDTHVLVSASVSDMGGLL